MFTTVFMELELHPLKLYQHLRMYVQEFEETAPSTGSTFAEKFDIKFHMPTSLWLVKGPGLAFSPCEHFNTGAEI